MEHAQHGFPVAAAALAASILWSGTPASAQTGHDVALNLRQNTVRIEAHAGDQTENGFGFIVGENEAQGVLYAATAYHVVAPEDVPGQDPVKVEVELYDHRGEMIEAKLLGTHDRDLAVITFTPPAGFRWQRKSLGRAAHQNGGTAVWFIGRSAKWDVPFNAAHVSSEEPNGELIEIDGSWVKPGSSGGPLIASSGIVGMVVNDSADGTQALSIEFIRRAFRRWNHPWTIESSAPPNAMDELADKGAVLARQDPVFKTLREQQPEAARRGFDIGLAATEGQTQWGPGKQKMLDSLAPVDQEGFKAASYFSLDRNSNLDLATTGAAIAEADPIVAQARLHESDARYWLGFDIATGIFGDPKRGAKGNTATGPGSLGIRDRLMSPAAQRGFNAAVELHLSRKY